MLSPPLSSLELSAAVAEGVSKIMTTPLSLNTSGVVALDKRVIVRPDKAEEQTVRGIILIPETVERAKFAIQKATVASVGELAWSEAENEGARYDRTFTPPIIGDRVMIGKHAGTRFIGLDGEDYVLLNDEDVIGRLAE